MWWARTTTTFRGWFAVSQAGMLVSGLVPGDFTFTIMAPDAATSTTATVTESTKGGLYYADVPSAFMVTHGAGTYGIVIEVNAAPTQVVASHTLVVSEQDIFAWKRIA
jgi:hypothetical protein